MSFNKTGSGSFKLDDLFKKQFEFEYDKVIKEAEGDFGLKKTQNKLLNTMEMYSILYPEEFSFGTGEQARLEKEKFKLKMKINDCQKTILVISD